MRTRGALGLFFFGIGLSMAPVHAANPDQIIRQIPAVTNIAPAAAPLIARLETEIGKILQAGHLLPFRVQYGEGKPRHLYAEPWMMMFTLARAYPHVGAPTQSGLADYLRQEMSLYPPWADTALGPVGRSRQGDPPGVPEAGLPPRYRRTGTMFYALWLYGHNTGNWADLQPAWNNLERIYAELAAGPPTYEMISAAIAMSRLARNLGGESSSKTYETDALKFMRAGLDFEAFRRQAHLACSGRPDWYRGSDGIAFALFHLTPEVARYIHEQPELKEAVSRYADRAAAVWPLWWMAQAPVGDGGYFDEGSCAGPETRMMLFNYQAWVMEAPARQLDLWVDVPDALIGDCYYLQNLVTAIEAHGRRVWH